MPGLQWLGTMPKKESALAQVLEKGVAGGISGVQAAERKGERAAAGAIAERRVGLEEERVEQSAEKLKQNLKNIAYEKKRDMANMVVNVAKTLNKDAADAFVNKPEVKVLFDDLDWPLPTGLHEEVGIKDAAVDAIARGDTLPGMTADETRKAAGVFVTPPKPTKITGADIKAFKEQVPWYEMLWPGTQTGAGKKLVEMKERQRKQFDLPGSTALDPLDPFGAR